MTLRIVFMGTPDFAVPTLAEILGAGHEVVAAYTQPPRPAGRGMAPTKSPVHLFAEQGGIDVRTPASLKGAAEQAEFAALRADAVVVVAYGLLLPAAVLAAPRFGCLNLHASALPRWRGAAPIQRAIMAGDTSTAAAIMRMEKGLDTGPVCLAEPVAIEPDMTAGMLHDVLMRTGAGLMTRALAALERGALDCQPQSASGVSYAAKIDKAEARIDFTRPAREVHNLIRGLSPFPGAWIEAGTEGKRERIKVLRACLMDGSGTPGEVLDAQLTVACADGAIRLLELQRAGKSPMRAADLLRGFPLLPGAQLGSLPR
jgi:methionyl-tRNA formyltransferase